MRNFYKKIKAKIVWLLVGGTVVIGATLSIGGPDIPIDSIASIRNAEISEIVSAETEYYQANGKYLQVLKGNKLPHYEKGSVAQKLGKTLPANALVNTYLTPEGNKGFFVQYQDNTGFYSYGYGAK